jgi:hypothetical protein
MCPPMCWPIRGRQRYPEHGAVGFCRFEIGTSGRDIRRDAALCRKVPERSTCGLAAAFCCARSVLAFITCDVDIVVDRLWVRKAVGELEESDANEHAVRTACSRRQRRNLSRLMCRGRCALGTSRYAPQREVRRPPGILHLSNSPATVRRFRLPTATFKQPITTDSSIHYPSRIALADNLRSDFVETIARARWNNLPWLKIVWTGRTGARIWRAESADSAARSI